MHPSVVPVAKRFLLRLVILLAFAALPLGQGGSFHGMFVLLTGVNTVACVIWALLRKEKPDGPGLTHWDEALMMAALFLLAQLF